MKKLIEINSKNESYYKNSIMEIGKSLVINFRMTKELSPVFRNLLLYFTGNKCDYDLRKGIYLFGEYGIGKTITMRIFSLFLQQHFNFSGNNFGNTSVEKIAVHFKEIGNLNLYERNMDNGMQRPIKTCINEFGKFLDEKHYGTSIQNVINSMLMTRYELFQEGSVFTHSTSNFKPNELNCFDDALIDRFKEMFNFIEIKGNSFRT